MDNTNKNCSNDAIGTEIDCGCKKINPVLSFSEKMRSMNAVQSDVRDSDSTGEHTGVAQDVIPSILKNIKIFYGMIASLVVFIILGFWIIKLEINALRHECLNVVPSRTLDIQNYGIIVDKSEFQNVLFSKSKISRRAKRESHTRKSFQEEVSAFIS
jgi:hypothetical protein